MKPTRPSRPGKPSKPGRPGLPASYSSGKSRAERELDARRRKRAVPTLPHPDCLSPWGGDGARSRPHSSNRAARRSLKFAQ
jgi:hypothetical protein